jgi:rSAM/selenodomain-associated transferase 1
MSCSVVFGRQPVAGRVKTRLASRIGDEAAAEVYRELLHYTLRTVRAAGFDTVLSLSCEPDDGWPRPGDVPVEVQPPGGLGDRLLETFRRRFDEGHRRVVIVGSDCATMTAGHIRRAVEALLDHPVVIGPARDGGYWLVGQRAPGHDLFSGIPWSSPDTLESTRRRLTGLDLRWHELDELEDLDTEDALLRALESADAPRELVDRLRAAWPDHAGAPS